MKNTLDTQCGRMYPERFPPTKERTFDAFLNRSAKSKTAQFQFLDLRNGSPPEKFWQTDFPLPGELSGRNFGEFPSDAAGSFLSQILEVQVPEKYYLTQSACRDILKKARFHGEELPKPLKRALERQAE